MIMLISFKFKQVKLVVSIKICSQDDKITTYDSVHIFSHKSIIWQYKVRVFCLSSDYFPPFLKSNVTQKFTAPDTEIISGIPPFICKYISSSPVISRGGCTNININWVKWMPCLVVREKCRHSKKNLYLQKYNNN